MQKQEQKLPYEPETEIEMNVGTKLDVIEARLDQIEQKLNHMKAKHEEEPEEEEDEGETEVGAEAPEVVESVEPEAPQMSSGLFGA